MFSEKKTEEEFLVFFARLFLFTRQRCKLPKNVGRGRGGWVGWGRTVSGLARDMNRPFVPYKKWPIGFFKEKNGSLVFLEKKNSSLVFLETNSSLARWRKKQ